MNNQSIRPQSQRGWHIYNGVVNNSSDGASIPPYGPMLHPTCDSVLFGFLLVPLGLGTFSRVRRHVNTYMYGKTSSYTIVLSGTKNWSQVFMHHVIRRIPSENYTPWESTVAARGTDH